MSFNPTRHHVTPEDAKILMDRLRRIATMACHGAGDTIRAIKNACGDYLEPRPDDGALLTSKGYLT
jgi:hypothetical protein